MNEDALRTMIREAIARQQTPIAPVGFARAGDGSLPLEAHASHFRYALPGSGDACLIEPAVQCNHCGYCQSHGH
jgi:hypothetical protein